MPATESPPEPFTGPLFLVGMPRSGTKLLRNLLNQHAAIHIPQTETEFFPMWAENWQQFGDLADWERFSEFFDRFRQLPYARYAAEAGTVVDPQAWYEACEGYSAAAVFEALIRLDTDAPRNASAIWGDKSPSYVRHMGLLKTHFPAARFVHLIRDVRDYALSIHAAWKKNMLRAAQRWADDVAIARSQGAGLGAAYLEIRYEDLLGSPEQTLRRICDFLGVDMVPAMLQPPANTENLGDARRARGILQSNANKYLTRMSDGDRRRIEALAAPVLTALDYPCDHQGPVRRLSRARMLALQLLDGVNLVRFRASDKGVGDALTFYARYFRSSGNRY